MTSLFGGWKHLDSPEGQFSAAYKASLINLELFADADKEVDEEAAENSAALNEEVQAIELNKLSANGLSLATAFQRSVRKTRYVREGWALRPSVPREVLKEFGAHAGLCEISRKDAEDRAGDPFVSDAPAQWFLSSFESLSDKLRDAIWRFVTRHQHDKLAKHIRHGNLNGLSNFLDIFRTLNGLLLSFNNRKIEGDKPVVPAPFVTTGIKRNIDLLIGYQDPEEGYVAGFVDSILANYEGDRDLVRKRLSDERLPQMLRAAAEAMIDVRRRALRLATLDAWSIEVLTRVASWLARQGLKMPIAEEVQTAGAEYRPISIAA